MTFSVPETNPIYVRALVVGLFGGLSLVLTHTFSRRGALMFPVYAAILLVGTLVTTQFPNLTFGTRFASVLLSLVIATACSLVEISYRAARHARMRVQAGKPPLSTTVPWWGMPVVFGSLVAVSAGAAILVR